MPAGVGKRQRSGSLSKNRSAKKQKIEEDQEDDRGFTMSKSSLGDDILMEEEDRNQWNEEEAKEDSSKSIVERVQDIFTNLNSENVKQQFFACRELERGCKHALSKKDKYEDPGKDTLEEQNEIRQKIQDSSILYRYLNLSPNCAELLSTWDNQFKEHNKKLCARIMEVLALILQANYFLSTRKSSNVISRAVVKEKLKYIYATFNGAFSPTGL